MPHTEYTFTAATGWVPLAPDASRLPMGTPTALSEGIPTALGHAGYEALAESREGEYGLGWFFIWRYAGAEAWPRYAIHVAQFLDEAVVWIATLPALWDFVRQYGMIGLLIPARHEDEEDDHPPVSWPLGGSDHRTKPPACAGGMVTGFPKPGLNVLSRGRCCAPSLLALRIARAPVPATGTLEYSRGRCTLGCARYPISGG